MNESYSKARQAAEKAFGKTQVETSARDRLREEQDAVVHARQEKTSRLREARLAMEAQHAIVPGADKPDENVEKAHDTNDIHLSTRK